VAPVDRSFGDAQRSRGPVLCSSGDRCGRSAADASTSSTSSLRSCQFAGAGRANGAMLAALTQWRELQLDQ